MGVCLEATYKYFELHLLRQRNNLVMFCNLATTHLKMSPSTAPPTTPDMVKNGKRLFLKNSLTFCPPMLSAGAIEPLGEVLVALRDASGFG